MKYAELKEIFKTKEKESGEKEHLIAEITFTKDSFTKPYSKESRTYIVSSDNKAFQPNKGGYSIYGSAKDGSDSYVRLEGYMAEEHGGKNGWKVEDCRII